MISNIQRWFILAKNLYTPTKLGKRDVIEITIREFTWTLSKIIERQPLKGATNNLMLVIDTDLEPILKIVDVNNIQIHIRPEARLENITNFFEALKTAYKEAANDAEEEEESDEESDDEEEDDDDNNKLTDKLTVVLHDYHNNTKRNSIVEAIESNIEKINEFVSVNIVSPFQMIPGDVKKYDIFHVHKKPLIINSDEDLDGYLENEMRSSRIVMLNGSLENHEKLANFSEIRVLYVSKKTNMSNVHVKKIIDLGGLSKLEKLYVNNELCTVDVLRFFPNLKNVKFKRPIDFYSMREVVKKVREKTNNPDFVFDKVEKIMVRCGGRILEFFPNTRVVRGQLKHSHVQAAVEAISRRTGDDDFVFDQVEELMVRCGGRILEFFPNTRVVRGWSTHRSVQAAVKAIRIRTNNPGFLFDKVQEVTVTRQDKGRVLEFFPNVRKVWGEVNYEAIKAAIEAIRNKTNNPDFLFDKVVEVKLPLKDGGRVLEFFPNVRVVKGELEHGDVQVAIESIRKKTGDDDFVFDQVVQVEVASWDDEGRALEFFPNVRVVTGEVAYEGVQAAVEAIRKKTGDDDFVFDQVVQVTSWHDDGRVLEFFPNVRVVKGQLKHSHVQAAVEVIRRRTGDDDFVFDQVGEVMVDDGGRVLEFFPNVRVATTHGRYLWHEDVQAAVEAIRRRTGDDNFVFDQVQEVVSLRDGGRVLEFFPNVRVVKGKAKYEGVKAAIEAIRRRTNNPDFVFDQVVQVEIGWRDYGRVLEFFPNVRVVNGRGVTYRGVQVAIEAIRKRTNNPDFVFDKVQEVIVSRSGVSRSDKGRVLEFFPNARINFNIVDF